MDSEEYHRAKAVLMSMMPTDKAYEHVSPDLVAGLRKRDFKVHNKDESTHYNSGCTQ